MIGGRPLWRRIADNLGVMNTPVVPALPAAIAALAMIAAAITLSVVPAVRTRRLRAVELLRAE